MKRAIVYIDGQNLRRSARDAFPRHAHLEPDVAKIGQAVVASSEGLVYAGTRYYIGIPPVEQTKKRATSIALLDRLRDAGASTYCNDLIQTAAGQQESGIDLKIGADMLNDLISRRAEVFVLASHDTDFEPVVAKIPEIAAKLDIKAQVVNLVCGGRKALARAREFRMNEQFFERNSTSYADIEAEADRRMLDDRRRAVDASAHRHRSEVYSSAADIKPMQTECVALVDVSSLDATSRRVLDKTHMDTFLPGLMRELAGSIGHTKVLSKGYVAFHRDTYDLLEHEFTKDLISDFANNQMKVVPFDYSYHTHRERRGPGAEHITRVPREKRLPMQMLCDAVSIVMTRKCKDLILVTDNPEMWPIVQLVGKLSHAIGAPIRIHHASMNPDMQHLHGANPLAVTPTMLERHKERQDRMDRARTLAANAMRADYLAFQAALSEQCAGPAGFEVMPEECVGTYHSNSRYWSAFDQGGGRFAIYPSGPLSVEPVKNVLYRLYNRGESSMVVDHHNGATMKHEVEVQRVR